MQIVKDQNLIELLVVPYGTNDNVPRGRTKTKGDLRRTGSNGKSNNVPRGTKTIDRIRLKTRKYMRVQLQNFLLLGLPDWLTHYSNFQNEAARIHDVDRFIQLSRVWVRITDTLIRVVQLYPDTPATVKKELQESVQKLYQIQEKHRQKFIQEQTEKIEALERSEPLPPEGFQWL